MYLSADDRRIALTLSAALYAGAARAADGAEPVIAAAAAVLRDVPGLEVDYLELIDERTWQTWRPATAKSGTARLLVAARLGSTRLIDNVPVTLAGTGRAVEVPTCS
jgi:pantoate--beta-alanine ligase